MSNLSFKPDLVETFMGGTFRLGSPKTLGELKQEVRSILEELDTWGDDDQHLSESIFWGNELRVGLKEGIVQ